MENWRSGPKWASIELAHDPYVGVRGQFGSIVRAPLSDHLTLVVVQVVFDHA